jgi:hypothetical protein
MLPNLGGTVNKALNSAFAGNDYDPTIITDPNHEGYIGSYGSYSGGTSTAPNPIVTQYQQAIDQTNNALGRLGNQENIALGNISGDFTNALQRLVGAKNRAQSQWEESKVNTTKDNMSARSDIDFATGQKANSLRRLLGARGSGSSSAFNFAAPYAAALEGSQQLRQVGDAFEKNMGALDTNWTNYQTDWNQSKEDLEAKKINSENSARADVAGKRANLLSTLAELMANKAQAEGGNAVAAAQPYLDQVNGLYGQIDNLGAQYFGKVNVADPNYKAPDLTQYDYDARQAAQFAAPTAAAQAASPYLATLLGKKKQQA